MYRRYSEWYTVHRIDEGAFADYHPALIKSAPSPVKRHGNMLIIIIARTLQTLQKSFGKDQFFLYNKGKNKPKEYKL